MTIEEFQNTLNESPSALMLTRDFVRLVRERADKLHKGDNYPVWADGTPYSFDECLVEAFNEIVRELGLEDK